MALISQYIGGGGVKGVLKINILKLERCRLVDLNIYFKHSKMGAIYSDQ